MIHRILICGAALCAMPAHGVSRTSAPAPVQATSAREQANKTLVLNCLDLLFNKKALARARTRCFGASYRQHNPRTPDGPDTIIALLGKLFEKQPDYSIDIKRAAADGDLVWVHYHAKSSPGDPGRAVVDIFRVQNGKLVEHWDVVQPVSTDSANRNSMF